MHFSMDALTLALNYPPNKVPGLLFGRWALTLMSAEIIMGSTYGSVGWPACGEVDIMEQNGWDKDNLIGHLHWGDTQTKAISKSGRNQTCSKYSNRIQPVFSSLDKR